MLVLAVRTRPPISRSSVRAFSQRREGAAGRDLLTPMFMLALIFSSFFVLLVVLDYLL